MRWIESWFSYFDGNIVIDVFEDGFFVMLDLNWFKFGSRCNDFENVFEFCFCCEWEKEGLYGDVWDVVICSNYGSVLRSDSVFIFVKVYNFGFWEFF